MNSPEHAPDPIREFVARKAARYDRVTVIAPDRRGRSRPRKVLRKVQSGWGFLDAYTWARDREVVDIFRHAAMFVALCADPKARAMPEHRVIHLAAGMPGCLGPQVLADTARALGISDERARFLVEQLAAEWNATQGLIGGGER